MEMVPATSGDLAHMIQLSAWEYFFNSGAMRAYDEYTQTRHWNKMATVNILDKETNILSEIALLNPKNFLILW